MWTGPPGATQPTWHAPLLGPCLTLPAGARPSSLRSLLEAHLGLGRMAGTEQLFTLTLSHHLTGF